MKVLVTGATGYIGAHVCKVLNDRGIKPDALDINLNQNNIQQYCDTVYKLNVRDPADLFRLPEYDCVVHLAGLIQVEESVRCPAKYYLTNTVGTINVLDNFPNAHFIFASTAGAFDPQSPYARSKIAAEDCIRQMSNNYTIFRFFNVAGSDGFNMQVGEATHLIRIAAECAANKRPGMSIFGDDYNTRDGTCIRDYIHVVDLAEAIANTIEAGPQNTRYECIGSGVGYTTKEVVATMKEVTGVNFPVAIAGRRAGDPPVLSIEGKYKYLTPNRTLQDMCRSAYQVELKRS